MTGKIKRSEVPAEFRQTEREASDRQKNWINDLLNERELTDEQRAEAEKRLEAGLTMKVASAWIDRLLTLPKKKSEFSQLNKTLPKVPDGRYAIMVKERTAGEDVETLKFFKVKMPTEGRWANFTFLDAGRGGAHGDLQWTPVKNLEYKKSVLKEIAKDPQAAGQKFGQEVGVCCRCGRSLTDETSRSLGIGPDCREKGW